MRLRLLIAGMLAYAILALAWRGRSPASNPSSTAEFDLLEVIDKAQVEVVERGKRRACLRQGRGFRCGPDAWAWVGPYAGRSGGRGARCLWIHPLRHAATTEVRLPKVPLGASVSLRASLLEGSGEGPSVFVRLATGRTAIGRVTVDDEWEAGVLEAEVPPGPRHGPLRLEVHANKNDWRKLCVELSMTGARRAAGSGATSKRGPGTRPGARRRGDRVEGVAR